MSKPINDQLTLGVMLRDEANFDNFYVSADNAVCVQAVSDPDVSNHLTYVWGPPASGRSHLLQALCSRQAQQGNTVMYLPLREKAKINPAMLEGIESLSLVCLDDVDSIGGHDAWESALFSLYNSLLETDTRLLITANRAPQQLSLTLADLRSRLQSGAVFKLFPLNDDDKRSLLCLRATNRGLDLSDSVAEYIVRRADRSPHKLMAVMDDLDYQSLQKGRALTVPFVREVMGW
ncbi:MAG: DnaA regulatory inactivator Hda [Gammaproteobacteria bacterium]|nr:DnaA regulatory inactivator Hda [Gammaproteobacteria bacterium]